MIAKVTDNRTSYGPVRCAFAARVRYICKKAAAIETANLAGEWTDAAEQMRMTNGLRPRMRHPAAHIVLTWPETEKPTDRQMIFAARMAMIEFGAGGNQIVIAVHRDTVNSHAHIVVNRVHPVTGKALSMSHDYARLELICRQIEQRMGWSADRGQFDVASDADGLRLVPKPSAHWDAKLRDREAGLRPDGRAARAQELRSGLPVLRDMISQTVLVWLRTQLAKAVDWEEVHHALFKHRLSYVQHKSGARIKQLFGPGMMPASQLGAAFGFHRLQQRLGAFVAKTAGITSAQHSDRVHGAPNDMDIPARFAVLQKLLEPIWARQRAYSQALQQRTRERHRLVAAQRREAHAVGNLLSGSRAPAAQALRAAMRDHHQTERQAFRVDHRYVPSAPIPPRIEVARHHPDEALRRRYRHILRHADAAEAVAIPFNQPTDITACRQKWFTASLRGEDHTIPAALRQAFLHYRNDIRSDAPGRLLIARRSGDGAIQGFDVFDLGSPADDGAEVHVGTGRGLILVGPRDATQCLITMDTQSVLTAAVAHQSEPLLVIGVGENVGREEAQHLLRLTADRVVEVAVGSAPKQQSVSQAIQALLPMASSVSMTTSKNEDPNVSGSNVARDAREPDAPRPAPFR